MAAIKEDIKSDDRVSFMIVGVIHFFQSTQITRRCCSFETTDMLVTLNSRGRAMKNRHVCRIIYAVFADCALPFPLTPGVVCTLNNLLGGLYSDRR
jgi:hypothetical protein